MEKNIREFLQNENAPVELLAKMDISIPTINLNEAIGTDMTRGNVTRLLKLLPIRGLIFDVSATWENRLTYYMQALVMSKTLTTLKIKNCNEEIRFLPPNLEELEIEGATKQQLLGYAISSDTIKHLSLTNGMISSEFFIAMQNRTRPLDFLSLNNIDIWLNEPDEVKEAMKNVAEIKITEMKWMGKPMHGELSKEIFGVFESKYDDDWDRETIPNDN